jgi:hypothetical protein
MNRIVEFPVNSKRTGWVSRIMVAELPAVDVRMAGLSVMKRTPSTARVEIARRHRDQDQFGRLAASRTGGVTPSTPQ